MNDSFRTVSNLTARNQPSLCITCAAGEMSLNKPRKIQKETIVTDLHLHRCTVHFVESFNQHTN